MVPFGLGIKILIRGEDNEQEIVDKNQKYKSIWIQVLAITIGLGADDIGVYIPLFTTLTGWEIMQMILVFGFGTALLCFISYQLTRIEKITSFIEKYERFIIGIIFVGIGMYVMYECGTFRKIAEML